MQMDLIRQQLEFESQHIRSLMEERFGTSDEMVQRAQVRQWAWPRQAGHAVCESSAEIVVGRVWDRALCFWYNQRAGTAVGAVWLRRRSQRALRAEPGSKAKNTEARANSG